MKRIASWNSSRFLTYSSLLFAIPAGYGYFNYNLIVSPLVLLTTSLISFNFWRNALDDWRRKLDIYFAKLSFSYFVINAFMYCPWSYSIFIGFPNLCAIKYCFNKSEELHNFKEYNKRWLVYHLGFHSLMITQLFIIMRYIGKNNIKIENSK